MDSKPLVLILAGGVGSRFWPASRERMPKQFLDLSGSGKSLLQLTYERFTSFIPAENIYVITHENYKDQTLNAILGINPDHVITEPSRNNTGASIALGSFKLSQSHPDAVCIVAPADHIISNKVEFQNALLLASEHANSHRSIITLGIKPSRPDTGYGYIEFEPNDESLIRKVKSFREKPGAATSQKFLDSGNFLWNSGIFVWKLNTIMDAFKTHAPGIFNILDKGKEKFNTNEEAGFIKQEYPKTEKISVDYAILEKADNVFTIPCDIGWSDLGTWNSLLDQSTKDESQNAILSKPVFTEDTHRTLIFSKNSKLVVVRGLEDYIIVDTDDCLMIYPKSEEQAIKSLKEKLNKEGFERYL